MALSFEGAYQVNAPREKIWDFIIDPNKIGKCLPDLRSLEAGADNKFTAIARVGVGLMKGDFKFQFAVVEQQPPTHARLKGNGKGLGSSVNMDVVIDLAQADAGTKLTYKADVQIAGTIASLGQRIIGGTAEKTIAAVFNCIKKQLET